MAIAVLQNNLQVYYEKLGKGTPVVFLHPPAMSHLVFKHQKSLSLSCQIILPDIRGHGQSDAKDSESFTLTELADDVAGLLDHLLIDEAVLCGYSSGGSIAQKFALKYPERTKGLILSGGFSEVSTPLFRKQFQTGFLLVKRAPALLNRMLTKTHSLTKKDKEELISYDGQGDPKAWERYYRESFSFNCTENIADMRFPLLFLYGEQSKHLHPYMNLYQKHVHHQAQFVMLTGAFHQLPIKHFDCFNQEVERFVSHLT
jgi:pimeloyl-ACP methyl ester carboxylesterase